MDTEFCGFASYQSNGGNHQIDTTLRLDFPTYQVPKIKGVKRKWDLIDKSVDFKFISLTCFELGRIHTSSSSDTKASSEISWNRTSSVNESDDASTVDLDFDFTLHLGNEKALTIERLGFSNMKSRAINSVDFDSSLSTGTDEYSLTTACPESNQFQNDIADESRSTKTSCLSNPVTFRHFYRSGRILNSSMKDKEGIFGSYNALFRDEKVCGGSTIGPIFRPIWMENVKEVNFVTDDGMNIDILKMDKVDACFDLEQREFSESSSLVPEGRVHGGSLLAILSRPSGLEGL